MSRPWDDTNCREKYYNLYHFVDTHEFYEIPLPAIYGMVIDENVRPSDFLDLRPSIQIGQSLNIWLKGGFPEPLIESVTNRDFYRQWMENYVVDYVTRDIRALEVSVSTIEDYLDIIHHTFLWRNLPPFIKNRLKKVQKSKKGFFRDQGLLHYFLRITDLDRLLLHPVASFSFASFVIEELVRGLQSTMATHLDFTYYRTVDKSEVDLVIEGNFGVIPVEVKFNASVKRITLRGLENFLMDTGSPYGILINRGKRVELLTDKIIQIPVHYL